jgi:DHA3 family macrolide efflux protein-like MFS transporter
MESQPVLDRPQPIKPSYRRVLSNRSFSLLWISQLVSQSGDFIFDVAALWLVLQLTGDTLKVGLAVAFVLLPAVVVGPFAGVYVDRFNRRDIMIAGNIFQAAAAIVIAGTYSIGLLNFPALLILLFVLNAGAQFVRPAVTAVVPSVTGKEDLGAANGLFSLTSSINQVAGYGIGGVIVLLFGPTLPILYDALTFVFAGLIVSMIARSRCAIPNNFSTSGGSQTQSSFKQKFLEGLKYVRGSRFLLELVVVGVLLNFFGTGIFALLAPYSRDIIRGNAGTYGLLLAMFSLGVILGSIFVGKIDSRKYVGKLLFLGVTAVGALTVALAFTTVAWLALGIAFGVGFFNAIVNIPLSVLVQAKIPGELLGRVATTLGALITLSQPISAATAGAVAGSISIGQTFLIYGSFMVFISAATYIIFGELRNASY